MNATDRTTLDQTPVPIDVDGRVARCMVIRSRGEWRTAWAMDGGRRPTPFGSVYASVKAAIAASRYLNAEGRA